VDFITSLAGATTKQQCDDNANTVAIFAQSLGVAVLRPRRHEAGADD
jgi:hypothetical protein